MIIREAEFLRRLLGKEANRRHALKLRSVQELQVSCRDATEYGSNTVEYTFTNQFSQPQACVLYRGATGITPPYYFGNAFYAAYYDGISTDNGKTYQQAAIFYDSTQTKAPTPLTPDGVGALVVLDTGSTHKLVCFVFMVPANGNLKMLEGGLSCQVLVDVHAYIVGIAKKESFCVSYSSGAVSQYQSQTGFIVKSPSDPFQVSSVLVKAAEPNIPTNEVLTGQYALEGECQQTQVGYRHGSTKASGLGF
jgi:hypothetical protein